MKGHEKILRVFQVINMLSEKRMEVGAIARELKISDRSAFRYIGLLKELGFQVIRQRGPFYTAYTLGSEPPPFIKKYQPAA